jgi:hypothetical protein
MLGHRTVKTIPAKEKFRLPFIEHPTPFRNDPFRIKCLNPSAKSRVAIGCQRGVHVVCIQKTSAHHVQAFITNELR